MTKKADGYATTDEAAAAINTLASSDYKKLMWAATYWWSRRRIQHRWAEPDDLLHEAVVLTLKGTKRWRKSEVGIVKHLDRAIENISGHLAGKGLTHAAACEAIKATTPSSTRGQSIEDTVAARDELELVTALFKDDQEALQLLMLKAREKSASEVRKELGMSNRAYDTVTKRIRRRLRRELPKLEIGYEAAKA